MHPSLPATRHARTLREERAGAACNVSLGGAARWRAVRLAAVADLLHGLDNVAGDGDRVDLEIRRVWHRDVGARDTLDGGVQIVERLALVDHCPQLGADAARGPALLDGDEAVGLHDRIDDRLAVERPQRANVDDLTRDAQRL